MVENNLTMRNEVRDATCGHLTFPSLHIRGHTRSYIGEEPDQSRISLSDVQVQHFNGQHRENLIVRLKTTFTAEVHCAVRCLPTPRAKLPLGTPPLLPITPTPVLAQRQSSQVSVNKLHPFNSLSHSPHYFAWSHWQTPRTSFIEQRKSHFTADLRALWSHLTFSSNAH